MKQTVICLVCGVLWASLAMAAPQNRVYEMQAFGEIPILDGGRVKPMDTYARMTLQTLYGKQALPDLLALDWLAELLFDPAAARQRPVFTLNSRDVAVALGLPKRKPRVYSFAEVAKAVFSRQEMIQPLLRKDPASLSIAQEQLVQLHASLLLFIDLSDSFSLMLPQIPIDDPDVAEWLGVETNHPLSVAELRPRAGDMAAILTKEPEGELAKKLLPLVLLLQKIDAAPHGNALKIVPAQWKEDDGRWFSPWSLLLEGRGSPQSAEYLRQWKRLAEHWQQGNADGWKQQSESIRNTVLQQAGQQVDASLLRLERHYYALDPFGKSLAAYIAALLCVMAGFLWRGRAWFRCGNVMLAGGILLHVAGIVMRMLIMSRPPVTTLYESILFVGLIAVLFGAWVEWKKRHGAGLLVAALVGAVLQFLGTRYAAEGDTMQVLVAVLNTNFWLATHVVVITIGYGCCLLAGTLSHGYLLLRAMRPEKRTLRQELHKNIRGIALVALLFSTLGTILGGIWADQSWGRFWGWDPKENGALLIVLWLLFLIHGRLCGYFRELGYAVGMVLTNVIVALAWFGVNLLSIGLHSYGFTRNIALNLGMFCGFELLFSIGLLVMVLYKERAGQVVCAPSPS